MGFKRKFIKIIFYKLNVKIFFYNNLNKNQFLFRNLYKP